MQTPDLINGIFEFLGSFFILKHCLALWQSKQANGISLLSTVYFSLWGFWNCWFYPHLGQWLSFAGGCAIMLANCFWIGLIIWIRRTGSKEEITVYIGAECVIINLHEDKVVLKIISSSHCS